MLLNTKDITTVQRYCRKGGLDPAPLLRSHVWKSIYFVSVSTIINPTSLI